MLKKILLKIGYLAAVLTMGFAMFYFALNPNTRLINLDSLLFSTGHLSNPTTISAPPSDGSPTTLSTKDFFRATLPDENGVMHAMTSFKGKIIVLNFWATWCPPCREEMPALSLLYEENKPKNVVVLGVAIDEIGLVKEFINASTVSYPVFASEEEGMALSNSLGNNKGVLPYTVIINADGAVIKTYFGRINKPLLEATLNNLIAH